MSLVVGFVTAHFANTQAKWMLCGLMVLGLRWVYVRLEDNARSKYYFLSEWCCPVTFIAAALLVPSSEGYNVEVRDACLLAPHTFSGGYGRDAKVRAACTVMVKCMLGLLAMVRWGDLHRYYAPKRPDEKDDRLADGRSLGSVATKSAVNKQAARQAAARRESAQLRAAKRKAESEERAMEKVQTEKEAATKQAEKRAAAEKAEVEEREAAKKRAVASAAARRELERKEAEKRAEAMKEEQMKDAARKEAEKTQVPIAE